MPAALNPEPYIHALQTCYPDLAIQSYAAINDGWDSFVLEVNSNRIFRFPRRYDVEQGLLTEIAVLPWLTVALPLPIPSFDIICQPQGEDQPYTFVGYAKIPGEPLPADLDLKVKERVAQQLAAFLTALHSFPVEPKDNIGVATIGQMPHINIPILNLWQHYATFYQMVVRGRVLQLGLLTPTEQAQVERMWDRFLTGLQQQPPAVALCHNDLVREHILYDPVRREVTGVIDWGDMAVGDPALDFAGLLAFNTSLCARVIADYETADANLWSQARFYRDIIPFHEIEYGAFMEDEGRCESGLAALRQVLSGR